MYLLHLPHPHSLSMRMSSLLVLIWKSISHLNLSLPILYLPISFIVFCLFYVFAFRFGVDGATGTTLFAFPSPSISPYSYSLYWGLLRFMNRPCTWNCLSNQLVSSPSVLQLMYCLCLNLANSFSCVSELSSHCCQGMPLPIF